MTRKLNGSPSEPDLCTPQTLEWVSRHVPGSIEFSSQLHTSDLEGLIHDIRAVQITLNDPKNFVFWPHYRLIRSYTFQPSEWIECLLHRVEGLRGMCPRLIDKFKETILWLEVAKNDLRDNHGISRTVELQLRLGKPFHAVHRWIESTIRTIQSCIMRQINDCFRALQSKLVKTSQIRQSKTITSLRVQGILGKVVVSALADTGSSNNIISASFAKRHKVMFDKTDRPELQLPSDSRIKALGSVTMRWKFSVADTGLPRSYTFLVVKGIKSDVILGDALLTATETLTRYTHRLCKVSVRTKANSSTLNLISDSNRTQRHMLGALNGIETSAIPDTGADTPFMSKAYALSRGFQIDTGQGSRTTVEYADGSRETTIGTVRQLEWKCGRVMRYVDFQVLENPTFNVLLHADLLLETDAFNELEKMSVEMMAAETISPDLECDVLEELSGNLFHITNLGLLDKAREWLKKHLDKNSHEQGKTPTTNQNSIRLKELQWRAYFDASISTIAEPAQSAAKASEAQRRLAWERKHLTPTNCSDSSSRTIPTSNSTNSSNGISDG